MKKAVLVIDMPDKCWKCPICASYQASAFSIREYWCAANENEDVDPDKKPDWCPLREFPEIKLSNVPYEADYPSYTRGFYDCLDEIMWGNKYGRQDQ